MTILSAIMDTLRGAYAAYGRRDTEALQAFFDDDCIIYTAVEGRAEPQPFRRPAGIRDWIENEDQVWASVVIDDLELSDLGDDRIFTTAVARVRGRASDLELSVPVWSIAEFRAGRIARFRSFADRADALDAAGLVE